MTREQYTQHKLRLDEQLRAGIQLLEAAHQAQIRALDFVWMLQSGTTLAPPAPAPAEPPPPPPARPRRRGIHELEDAVREALPRLPERFTRADVCTALGEEPDRGALYRILQQLVQEGSAAVAEPGTGRTPAIYRKTGAGEVPSQA